MYIRARVYLGACVFIVVLVFILHDDNCTWSLKLYKENRSVLFFLKEYSDSIF